MKIFEIIFTDADKKAWVYAETIIDALKVYFRATDTDLIDLESNDDIVELPKEKWKDFTVYDDESESDDSNKMSFEEWVNENKTYGSDLIAVTID